MMYAYMFIYTTVVIITIIIIIKIFHSSLSELLSVSISYFESCSLGYYCVLLWVLFIHLACLYNGNYLFCSVAFLLPFCLYV